MGAKEAYERIEKKMQESYNKHTWIGCHAGWIFQEALNIIEEECPEVLEEPVKLTPEQIKALDSLCIKEEKDDDKDCQ